MDAVQQKEQQRSSTRRKEANGREGFELGF